MRKLLGIGFATMLCSAAFAQEYRITRAIPLGGNGAWDYLKTNAESRRLYVSHSDEVTVLDLDTQQQVGKLSGFRFIHGIVICEGAPNGLSQ
jgi:hypothetical protein